MSDTEKTLLRLLCVNAYEVYCSTLHSCDAPCTRDLGAFCKNVQPGNLVMECSTIWMPERDEHRLGRLLRTERRPMHTPEEWAAMGAESDEPIPTDLYWVIQRLDGSEYHWHNATFIRVSEKPGMFDDARRARIESSLPAAAPTRGTLT